MRTPRAVVAIAGVLVLIVAGCSSGTGPTSNSSDGSTDVRSSLTYDQAAARADANAQESLHALPDGAKLESLGPPNPVPCSDDDGAPPTTPVSIQSDYFVNGLEAAQNKRYLDDLVKHWQAAGWSIRADRRPNDQFVSLDKAGFGVVFQLSSNGDRLGLSTTSPCVTPKTS